MSDEPVAVVAAPGSPAPDPDPVHQLEREQEQLIAARQAALHAGNGGEVVRIKQRLRDVAEHLTTARLQAALDRRRALEAEDATLAAQQEPLEAARKTAHATMWEWIQSEPDRLEAEKRKTDKKREAAQTADRALEPIVDRRHLIVAELTQVQAEINKLV